MQELGHVQLHATFHGAEQLEVEDGLAELQMQKTRVNTGYSGHTLTSTLPAPMYEGIKWASEANENLTYEIIDIPTIVQKWAVGDHMSHVLLQSSSS